MRRRRRVVGREGGVGRLLRVLIGHWGRRRVAPRAGRGRWRVRGARSLRGLDGWRIVDVDSFRARSLGCCLLLELPRLADVLPSDVLGLGLQTSSADEQGQRDVAGERRSDSPIIVDD